MNVTTSPHSIPSRKIILLTLFIFVISLFFAGVPLADSNSSELFELIEPFSRGKEEFNSVSRSFTQTNNFRYLAQHGIKQEGV